MVENHGVVSLPLTLFSIDLDLHVGPCHIPIECRERTIPHTTVKARDHTQGVVLRRDPSHPVESVKGLEQLIGEPARLSASKSGT